MGSQPKVSVAIPVYNGERFVAKAIQSVLDQTFADLELIVTDNASGDGTRAICEAFAARDPRVRYHRNDANLGANRNYNLGLQMARGRYFKWMAHDDWISANYLEKCAKILDEHPCVGLAFGMPQEMLDEDTIYINTKFTVPLWGAAGPVERFARATRMDRTCHAIFGLYRRELLERTTKHRPYYTSDRNLVAETALLGKFVAIPEAIFYNRKHQAQSMAMSHDRLALNTWADTSNTKPYSTQNLSRLRHVFEIVGRHRDVASPVVLFASVATFFFSPVKILRYADEGLSIVLPRAHNAFREILKLTVRVARKPDEYIVYERSSGRADD